MNLLLLDHHEIDASGAARLTDGRAGHLLKVLKVAPGASVRVGVVDGARGVGTVVSCADGAVELRCAFDRDIPDRPAVDLLLALPRPKVLRRLWSQLAALGVGQIILTNAARVERNYFDTHVLSPDCYRPLLIEGLQQARDTRLPQVTIHRQFKVLIEDAFDDLVPDGLRIVAHPACDTAIVDVVCAACPERASASRRASDQRVLIAIGPEGGWNEFELALLAAHGFAGVGLGPRTLRTDTAAVALLALAHQALRAGNAGSRG